jgi:hypothetical protein
MSKQKYNVFFECAELLDCDFVEVEAESVTDAEDLAESYCGFYDLTSVRITAVVPA